jgi:L,D-transpeptidase catalytic domain
MRRLLLVIFTLALFLGKWQHPQRATAAPSYGEQENSGASVLCLPGIYMYDPGDCLPAGPSGYLTQMAEKGLTFPIARLGYTPVDPALGQVDTSYGEVVNMPAPVYPSIDDAVNSSKKSASEKLNGQFVFISYSSNQQIEGKKIYEIRPGAYMTGNYISRLSALPPGRGIIFTSTPLTSFGWVLTYFSQTPQIEVHNAPGGGATGRLLNLYDIVQVFGEQKVGDDLWYMIGPDEWVLAKFIARVIPNVNPPAGVSENRWIEVNLFEQTLAVYDNRQLVFATIIASGAEPFWTRPGVFQIYEKHDSAPMTGSFEADRSDAYYLEDVPWTMYYDGARALHGAYWRAKMGFPQSHGCVNLTVTDAHWIYNWAQNGDWVYVWDPTGQTPTDPELYKGGGY